MSIHLTNLARSNTSHAPNNTETVNTQTGFDSNPFDIDQQNKLWDQALKGATKQKEAEFSTHNNTEQWHLLCIKLLNMEKVLSPN